jgi:hypothetical protein
MLGCDALGKLDGLAMLGGVLFVELDSLAMLGRKSVGRMTKSSRGVTLPVFQSMLIGVRLLGGDSFGKLDSLAMLGGDEVGKLDGLAMFGGGSFVKLDSLAMLGRKSVGKFDNLAMLGGDEVGKLDGLALLVGGSFVKLDSLAMLGRKSVGRMTKSSRGVTLPVFQSMLIGVRSVRSVVTVLVRGRVWFAACRRCCCGGCPVERL